MTSLYFGLLRDGVPADEKVVRSTTAPYEPDAPAAVQDSMPDQQEVTADPNPDLGMVGRQLASHWVSSEKSTPAWIPESNAQTEHNAIVDRQVASSGTAAAREASGVWGHGTMAYAVGIAPVGDLTDGGKMGNEYFVRTPRDIQETADDTMMTVPPGYDQSTKGRVAALGKADARVAAVSAQYDAFWNGGN
jgi:hypothetical protein